MQKLIEILSDRGIQMTEQELKDRVKAEGCNPDDLSNADISKLVRIFASGGGLTVAPKQAASASRRKSSKQRPQSQDASGLASMAQQIDAEMAALTYGVSQGAEAIVSRHEENIYQIMESAPGQLVERVAARAGAYVADVDHFRNIGQQIFGGLIPNGDNPETIQGSASDDGDSLSAA